MWGWYEHFENVAKLAGWKDHWRLVHLTSHLHDSSTEVRGNYSQLVAAMKRRFTSSGLQLTGHNFSIIVSRTKKRLSNSLCRNCRNFTNWPMLEQRVKGLKPNGWDRLFC